MMAKKSSSMVAFSRKAASIAVAGVIGIGGLAAAPANAASNISPSKCDSDYFRIRYDYGHGLKCWANAGTAYISLRNVTQVSTGNNAGWVQTSTGKKVSVGRGTITYFNNNTTLTVIHIN